MGFVCPAKGSIVAGVAGVVGPGTCHALGVPLESAVLGLVCAGTRPGDGPVGIPVSKKTPCHRGGGGKPLAYVEDGLPAGALAGAVSGEAEAIAGLRICDGDGKAP